jgi:FMN phosphatase YigB (HAD superfamily)
MQDSSQIDWQKIKAVIFDVDGTLYNLKKMRRLMFLVQEIAGKKPP